MKMYMKIMEPMLHLFNEVKMVTHAFAFTHKLIDNEEVYCNKSNKNDKSQYISVKQQKHKKKERENMMMLSMCKMYNVLVRANAWAKLHIQSVECSSKIAAQIY